MWTLVELPLLVAVAVFTGYLALLTGAALVARLRRKPERAVAAPRHRFAVVIPAHNESRTLPALLGRLREIAYPRELYEVVVIADHCTDSTAALARAGAARVIECVEGVRGGKGLALGSAFATLLAENRHDAFVILDADSDPAPTLLGAFDRELQRGAQALQGHCKIGNAHESWRTALMAADLALVHLLRPLGKQELGASAGLQGNGCCLTRGALGRVTWQTRSVAEDHEYHVRLVLAGVTVRFVPDAEVATVMEPTLEAAEGQELRWEGGRFEVARAQVPPLARAAFRRRSWPCLDAALDLAIPPFALLGAGTAIMAALHAVLWIVGFPAFPTIAWATLLLAQTFYVIVGCALARVPARTYLALVVFAPRYALSKVAICARVARRGTAEWTPTIRRAT